MSICGKRKIDCAVGHRVKRNYARPLLLSPEQPMSDFDAENVVDYARLHQLYEEFMRFSWGIFDAICYRPSWPSIKPRYV